MKTHLEVARDAVRSAGLEELADALEWAAAAVKHRATLLSAARWAAGGRWMGDEWVVRCSNCSGADADPDEAVAIPHDVDCPMAEMLHALDPDWSREELISAHSAALNTLRAVRGPILPTIGSHLTEAALLNALNPVGAVHYPASAVLPLPPGINDGVNITLYPGPTPRIITADGDAWELQPAGPSPDGGLTRVMQWVAVPAQPQPEDDVTPPASPPPAR